MTNAEGLTFNNDSFFEKIKGFKARKSDIILMGYPRSGTTWTQEMVWLIANDLDYEGAKVFIDERFPNLDVEGFQISNYPDLINLKYYSDSIKFVENMKDPRFIKIHVKPTLLADQLLDNPDKPKLIYVSRNVKDCCLSLYHYFKNFAKLYSSDNFEEYCEQFMLRDDILGNYWDNVLCVWERRHQDNVLFIKYEEMIQDLLGVIRKVATFLNKHLTEDQENKLLQWLNLENVRTNPALNHVNIFKKSGFVRAGQTGTHKKEMSPEMIAKFDSWSRERVKGTGYEL